MESEYIVSVEWLNSNLDNDKLIVLDASLKPITSKDENGNNKNVVIPTARKFDLKNAFSDTSSLFDHTLPKPTDFIKEMRSLGISDDSIIVVYDNQGIYSSPRAWYMIKSMGHKNTYVLNGGMPAWINKGLPVIDYAEKTYAQGDFSNKVNTGFGYFCDTDVVLNSINNSQNKIIDARSEKRFYGLEPEPRPTLKSGHIPNSINLPFDKVLDNGNFKNTEELKGIFSKIVTENNKLIFSCGSGVTSCIIALAAQISGYKQISVFDGSWSEWGDENSKFPISTTNSIEEKTN